MRHGSTTSRFSRVWHYLEVDFLAPIFFSRKSAVVILVSIPVSQRQIPLPSAAETKRADPDKGPASSNPLCAFGYLISIVLSVSVTISLLRFSPTVDFL